MRVQNGSNIALNQHNSGHAKAIAGLSKNVERDATLHNATVRNVIAGSRRSATVWGMIFPNLWPLASADDGDTWR